MFFSLFLLFNFCRFKLFGNGLLYCFEEITLIRIFLDIIGLLPENRRSKTGQFCTRDVHKDTVSGSYVYLRSNVKWQIHKLIIDDLQL